jgi:hypothetical protein
VTGTITSKLPLGGREAEVFEGNFEVMVPVTEIEWF